MQEINEFLILIDQYLGSSWWFVPLLLGTGIFFTVYLGFPQVRYFSFALKVVRGRFDKKSDQGDTSHFQALTTALSVRLVQEILLGLLLLFTLEDRQPYSGCLQRLWLV